MSETLQRESVADVVDENRDVFELVAGGDDGAAEIAQNILDEVESGDE